MSLDLIDWFVGVSQNAGWDLVKFAGSVVIYRIFAATARIASVSPSAAPSAKAELKFEELPPSEQIAARLKAVIGEFGKLNLHDAGQTLSIAKLAELLGHKDLGILQAVLSNGTPLAFEDENRICGLLGINKTWLRDGTSTPFFCNPVYSDPVEFAKSYLGSDKASYIKEKYATYYFVLCDGEGSQADVYARWADNPYKFDLLFSGVPIRESVGKAGRCQIIEFCAFCPWFLRQRPSIATGRRISAGNRQDLANGIKHPGWLVQSGRNMSDWHEDIGDIEYKGRDHGEGYAFAHRLFSSKMDEEGVTRTDEVVDWFDNRISPRHL